jgi:small subunit ribosomal protein S19e
MSKIDDIKPTELIEKTALELKKLSDIRAPEWAAFAKTGTHKERPPAKQDWWYTRAAAVLRTVYALGPIGVSKLRTKYGGRKNYGYAPEHHVKGSGNIIRKILQQLERADLIKQTKVGVHKGRVVTRKGKALLESAAQAK